MSIKKKAEEPVVDFALIAIALTRTMLDLTTYSRRVSEWGYMQTLTEYEVEDLVVNTSDVFLDETCLDRVGTVLEIRDNEVEIRRLDGVTRCAIARTSTYVAAKGVKNV